jgi:hypothetical protein
VRVGYSYWGFLGDHKIEGGKEVSTPDGNATYGWSIIHELQQRGHQVYGMQQDRDVEAVEKYGPDNFAAFNKMKRWGAWRNMIPTMGERFPELDILFVEWRFPIFGRNCHSWEGAPCFPSRWYETGYDGKGSLEGEVLQPDLFRQSQLLKHYKERGTKIVFWDLDHKLLPHDEEYWRPDAIFETSVQPRLQMMRRTRVEFPTVVEDLLEHRTLACNPMKKLVYIGSRYERDDVITEWIKPVSDFFPGQVEFWGNWLKTVDECRKLWPNVSYNDRITTRDFRRVYGDAVAVPLLSKRSYMETGFVTPRPWEALLFGTIPIGLCGHRGIEDYCYTIAHDPETLIDIVDDMCQWTVREREIIREQMVINLQHMDVSRFVDKIEDVANGSVELVP